MASHVSRLKVDAVIIGGGFGGVAAALSLLQRGHCVVIAEETDWLGGQVSSQGVPPDEHSWIEREGGTALYRKFRNRVRSYYQRNYPLAESEAENVFFNPGKAGVSTLSHEPRIAWLVIQEMLSSYLSSRKLTVLYHVAPQSVAVSGDKIKSVSFRHVSSGDPVEIEARFFLDASETGEFLKLSGIRHVTGSEGSDATGEPSSTSREARPDNMQAITWVAAIGFDPLCPDDCDRYRIPKPELYTFWKNYQPELTPEWPGKLLSTHYTSPFTLQPIEAKLFPNFWGYRRIIARSNFARPEEWGEATILNWPQNDYFEHEILLCSEAERTRRLERARQLTLSWIYWLQTEMPRPDGGTGYGGIHLRPDVTGTRDGLAKAAYIRETRRISALRTVTELDIGVEARDGREPDHFFDSVGTGYYRIDLHPTTGGDNYVDIEAFPFQIPMGALISPDFTNFLAAGKTLGTTHITNGCYRLHPVEWNVGEVAGALASWCMARRSHPQALREDGDGLSDFQSELTRMGIPLTWSRNALDEHRAKIKPCSLATS